MEEDELRVILEKEETTFENEEEDINGDEDGILCGILEDFMTHEGTGRLVTNYKVVLRVVDDPSKVNTKTLISALKVICEGLKVSIDEVMVEGGDVKKMSPEQWKTAKRSTITLLFLFYKAMTNIESKVFAEHHNLTVQVAAQATKRRGGKKTATNSASETNFGFWDDYREKLVVQMNRLMKCPIDRLWESGINFIRAITQAVVTVVNNPSSRLVRNLDLADELFTLLGQLCSRYDEQSGVINRLLPLIKNGEDTAKVVAYGVNLIETKFHVDRIVFNAIKEVLEIYNNQPMRETPAERAVALFLHEMARLSPKGIVAALPFVVQFLESESSTIRGSVLAVTAELLTWSKVPDANLQDSQLAQNPETDFEALRDDVLQYLVLHMRDTNALVRNKALQLAAKLATDSCLYLPEIVVCAEQAKGRLMDKAATTRKFAVGLLTAAVYCDPIVIKFSSKEFKKQIRELRVEFVQLLTDSLPLEKKMKAVVKEFVQLVKYDSLSDLKLPSDIQEPEAALEHITKLLNDGSIYQACQFLYLTIQEFVQHPEFQPFEKQMKSAEMYLTFFKKSLNLEIRDSDDEDDEGRHGEGNIEDAGIIESEACKTKRQFIKYMETCHSLALIMESALPSMTILLELGTAADKAEVIEFFAAITESGYVLDERVTGGIIEAVAQLQQSSRADLMSCTCRIFLKGCNTSNELIRRLFDILSKLPSSHREHLGVLIEEMVKSGKIDKEHFEMLWDAFGLTNNAWKKEDSKYAVFIIGIVGRTEMSVISSNIQYLIDQGLGPRALEDFELARNTCEALMMLCPKQSKNEAEEDDDSPASKPIRFSVEHPLYAKLVDITVRGMSKKLTASADQVFSKVCELVVQLVYRTCMDPKTIITQLLVSVHDVVFGPGRNQSEIKDTERVVCRYLSFATSLLGAHVFYHENVVLVEVKRRKKNMSAKSKSNFKVPVSSKSGRGSKSVTKSKSRNVTINTTANTTGNTTTNKTRHNDDATVNGSVSHAEANEMDAIIGNIGYDAETESIRTYLEKILDTGVFKQLRSHTLFICQNFEEYKSLQLKIAAVRALSKIMSISNVAVLRSSETFLALWKRTKNSEVKCELIRAAILLNVRFPNQMEECNLALLAGLRDTEECVRVASLDFITFLALNDLVKIRDQLTDVALCVIDDNVEVREMAKDFLEQCGEKDNMLNNALPDIISKLSSRDELEQTSFQEIMKFLLERVKKDKLLLGFVEKLLFRFRVATKGRQCQDIAFCLNQLTYNDKSFKIIKDNLNNYHDKLGDEYVFDAFTNIIASLRKTSKPEMKAKIDEYEKEVGVARGKCVEIDRMEAAVKGQPNTQEAAS